MATRRIALTRTDNVRPLGDFGQRSWEYLTGVVEREIGMRHAALFARPADVGSDVAWSTELPGEIQSLRSLAEGEADALRTELRQLADDILALADRYAGERDPAAQALANALRNAVEVPNDECIFRVGDQPVIIQWAHHLDVYEPPRGVLSRIVRPAPPPSGSPAAPTGAASHVAAEATAPAAMPASAGSSWLWWLGWLLLALMISWLIWLALPACGLAPLPWLDSCPRAAERLPALGEDAFAIDREIAELERRIADRERTCIAEAPRQVTPDRGIPAEPENPPAPPVEPEPPSLEEVIRDEDASKLEGCWDLTSDYTLYDTQNPRISFSVEDWQVCFDGEGGGDQEVTFSDGTVCRGPVDASFGTDGSLTVMDVADVPCGAGPRRGSRILQRRTVCSLGDGAQVACRSGDADKPDQPAADVTFRRQPIR
jgi:hypothetical protein